MGVESCPSFVEWPRATTIIVGVLQIARKCLARLTVSGLYAPFVFSINSVRA